MKVEISPEIERVFGQLKWLDRRTSRVIESVSAHFGRPTVENLLSSENLQCSPISVGQNFQAMMDERDSLEFLESLAFETERHDAAIIVALRKRITVYQQHVDEQILFGSRTAGQEAGREFLSRSTVSLKDRSRLSVPEAVQAVFELTYSGLPGEQNHFLCLRSLGSSTVHSSRSPHLAAWKAAGADPKFLSNVRLEWVNGILDIVSPEVSYSVSRSIEQGNEYGLAHFYIQGLHAGP